LAACGGGGGDDEELCETDLSYLFDCPPKEVKVNNFQVFGNVLPVNGREQVVAGINNGTFQIVMDIDRAYSDEASIWVSDLANLESTNLEQQLANFTCGYSGFCHYNFAFSCSFTADNRVSCGMRSGGDGPIQETYPVTDLNSLLSGSQTDLVVVLTASAGPHVTPAQRVVPVTFRYN
jgi:hypothetical protein